MMVGSIIYEEKINMSKEATQNTIESVEEEQEENTVVEKQETPIEEENTVVEKEEYVGEEEKEVSKEEETYKSKDERAIELAKGEWGADDTVTFSVEEKSGSKYYVAVKSEATVITWYEVDTETWEISEYY